MELNDEKKAAIEDLSKSISRVLRAGLSDLPVATRSALESAVLESGCRIQFTLLMAPLVVACHLVRPGHDPVTVFAVETDAVDDRVSLH